MPGGLETKKCISNIIYIEIFNIYERLLGRASLLCVSIKASGGSAFPDKCEQTSREQVLTCGMFGVDQERKRSPIGKRWVSNEKW